MARLSTNRLPKSPLRIVVLGGGVSGLAAAHAALQSCKIPVSVTLLESTARLGGWVNTIQYPDGCTFELGPRTLRCVGRPGHNTLQLVSTLGIQNEVLPVTSTHPSASKRYIFAKGKLNMLPTKLSTLFSRQPPLTQSIMSSIIKEPFQQKSSLPDESVHEFFSRRVGKEIADYLVDSLCRGIFASGAKELSIGACFPYLFKYEQDYGSLLFGAILSKQEQIPAKECSLYEKSKNEKWRVWTFKNGMQTLVDHWVPFLERRGLDVRLGTVCKSLQLTPDNRILCETANNGIIEADHVISATSASHLSFVLPQRFDSLKTVLNSIRSVSVGVVNLEYKGRVLPVDGFGFLVPSCEPLGILGVVFDSCVIEQGGNTKLTVMAGGSKFQELFGNPDTADEDLIKQVALDGVQKALGITAKPLKCLVSIQKDCIPQYRVGHLKKLDQIQNCISDDKIPLTVVGSSYKAVGINDCIYNAKTAVEEMLDRVI